MKWKRYVFYAVVAASAGGTLSAWQRLVDTGEIISTTTGGQSFTMAKFLRQLGDDDFESFLSGFAKGKGLNLSQAELLALVCEQTPQNNCKMVDGKYRPTVDVYYLPIEPAKAAARRDTTALLLAAMRSMQTDVAGIKTDVASMNNRLEEVELAARPDVAAVASSSPDRLAKLEANHGTTVLPTVIDAASKQAVRVAEELRPVEGEDVVSVHFSMPMWLGKLEDHRLFWVGYWILLFASLGYLYYWREYILSKWSSRPPIFTKVTLAAGLLPDATSVHPVRAVVMMRGQSVRFCVWCIDKEFMIVKYRPEHEDDMQHISPCPPEGLYYDGDGEFELVLQEKAIKIIAGREAVKQYSEDDHVAIAAE